MSHICKWFVKPLTMPKECSWVELVATGPQLPAWFRSHAWSTELHQTVEMLAWHQEVHQRPGTCILAVHPVFIAAETGHTESIEVLAGLGADVSQANHDGVTPIGMAAAHNRVDVVDLLVRVKASVNPAPDNWGDIPLSEANMEIVEGLGLKQSDCFRTVCQATKELNYELTISW
eukprot:TRINITY_DN9605_c0_g1_i1.p1 TRINITY_DN9605_c0_g1~~TRINITY_DN9605_c0_g1_i1.p1  ORF type:complete len:175 (-),score=29.71 TRINITY_DN9605_c0_g1_i1:212-736(-)